MLLSANSNRWTHFRVALNHCFLVWISSFLQVDSNDPPRCIEPCYGSDLVTGYGHMPGWWGGRGLKIWDVDDAGCCFFVYLSWRATLGMLVPENLLNHRLYQCSVTWVIESFLIEKSVWGFKTNQYVFSSQRCDVTCHFGHQCVCVCVCVMFLLMPFELPVANPAWNSWVDKHSFGWRTCLPSPSVC